MGNCKILNCKTKKGEHHFFNVPHDPNIRKQWVLQIERHQTFDNIPISYPICALHFEEDQIIRKGKRTTLKEGSVPTIFTDVSGRPIVYEQLSIKTEPDFDEPTASQYHAIAPETTQTNEPATVNAKLNVTHSTANRTQNSVDPFMEIQQPIVEVKQEPQEENENPIETNSDDSVSNVPESAKMITITREEYARLLRVEVQLMKYKELCEKKTKQLKELQSQVAHYKKQAAKRRKPNEPVQNNSNNSSYVDIES